MTRVISARLTVVLLIMVIAVLPALMSGCTALLTPENPEQSLQNSRLAYAAADGIYVRSLAVGETDGTTGAASQKIYEGKGPVRPVFSQDGTRLLFKQPLDQTAAEQETGVLRSVLYAYDFKSGQAIKVLDNPVSYSAGPDGSFQVSTEDGRLMRVNFRPEEQEGASVLSPEMEEQQIWPEIVPKDPKVTIRYENLKPSPDFHYLAYDVRVRDARTPEGGWPEGFDAFYYSGGLYVLNEETSEAAMVVEPIRASDDWLGNDPEPGPWSPDGKILFVWDKPQSASLTADGVNGFFYHADTGQRTEYEPGLLAYDENISYSEIGTVAVLSGMGREMFSDKNIDLITDVSGPKAEYHTMESISEKGLVPAMPQLSADGNTLYFAAFEKNTLTTYPLKRQLYSLKLDSSKPDSPQEIQQITSDPAYRSENPVLLKDGKHLVFGRANANAYDGKMSLWMVSVDGKDEIKLAEWTEPENADQLGLERYNDYYGRGNWSGLFAIYDATKE